MIASSSCLITGAVTMGPSPSTVASLGTSIMAWVTQMTHDMSTRIKDLGGRGFSMHGGTGGLSNGYSFCASFAVCGQADAFRAPC